LPSSFAYKDTSKPLSDIASELGVAHILEGSVRSAGERIRVTAQLIRASDGFHLWSQNYDRDVADMIGIQEDLASSIATALETSMDPEALAEMAQAGTDSVEAYQAYLRGLKVLADSIEQAVPVQSSREFIQAYEHFERARAIDPGFAEAHVSAANYWKVELTPSRTDTGSSGLEPRQMLNEYNARIGLAIRNARNEADRIRSMADRAMVDLRLRESRQLFEEYLRLRPNDGPARFEYAQVLGMLSEREALREVLAWWKARAQSDISAANFYANEAYRIVDPSEAADVALRYIARWPSSAALLYQVHRTLVWAGRYREASEVAARFEALLPDGNQLMRARQACAAGDRAAAEAILEAELEDPDAKVSNIWLLHNMLGNTRQEIEVLRPLEQSGVPWQLASFLGYHKFDPRPYPSLMAILEREGVERPPPVEPPFKCPPPTQPSIAVLPFVNMSADPDNEYFSDGVAEEILNVLARIPELKVSARTSAFSYKGANANIAQIASDLGVNHVLEGSVRKSGDQVRVTAQLIEADSGFHLWSETYDRELTNIFAIQDEIAQAIAAELKVKLLPAPEQPNLTGTTNLEAYQLYLQGVNLWHLRTGESLERALVLLEQAVALDPDFARAWAYLALTWSVISDYTDRPMAEARIDAREAAQTALALDPASIEAATALMNPLMADSASRLETLIEQGRELLAGNPGFATTHQWHATNLLHAGRVEEAIEEFEYALELDPRSRVTHENLSELFLALGRFEDADRVLQSVEAFAPDYWDGIQTRFEWNLVTGRQEAAQASGERLARLLGRNRDATGLYLDLFFDPQRKAAAAAEIAAFPRDNWWDPDNPSLIDEFGLAEMLAAAGAYDEALDVLRWSMANDGDYWALGMVRISRIVGDFHCRPDVQGLYAEVGLPPLPEPPDCTNR